MIKKLQKLSGATQLLRVMAAQSTSTYANQVIAFTVPWIVLSKTGSAADAGLVAFAMGISALIGILVGGVITDRISGRKVSMIADSLSFITAFLLAMVLFFDFFSLWIVIVSQIIGVFFDGPGTIAKNTTVPAAAKVGSVPLVRAMGLQQTLQNVAMFVGPVTAGVLIAVLTESITLMVAGILFVAAIYLVSRLPRKLMVQEHRLTPRRAYGEMKEAVLFIAKEPFLGPMQLFGPFYAFIIGSVSTIVFTSWFVFADQSSLQLGIFLGAQAIGGMLGGILFAALAPKVSQQGWLFGATMAYALSLFALSMVQPGSLLGVGISFLSGLVFTGIMAIPYAAFYTRTPERLLGRVNSIGAACGFLVVAVASLFFGWLVTTTSPQTSIVVCAISMGVMGLGVLLFPFMKLLDQPLPEPTK